MIVTKHPFNFDELLSAKAVDLICAACGHPLALFKVGDIFAIAHLDCPYSEMIYDEDGSKVLDGLLEMPLRNHAIPKQD